MPDTLDATAWPDRPTFEKWFSAHVIRFNALSVTDPARWERIARAVERFQQEHPQ